MRKPPMSELRKSSGAFDLPSILTGVVVVGILTAGVLAAIFGVIPFSQDHGAKQDLSSIRTAEGAARAKDNRFMDHAGLLDVGYLHLSSTKTTKVMSDEKGTCYFSIAKSGSGKVFYATDRNPDPEILTADTEAYCLSAAQLAELIEDVGGIEDGANEEDADTNGPTVAVPKNLTFIVSPHGLATATWDKIDGATGYIIEYQIGGGGWILLPQNGTASTATVSAPGGATVNIRVTARKGEYASAPATSSVTIPNYLIPNPSFEQGRTGWDFRGGARVVSNIVRSGSNSLLDSNGDGVLMFIKVPAETPILTYWSTGPTAINGSSEFIYPTGEKVGSWTKYKYELGASPAGKGVYVIISGTPGRDTYIDDIALEPPMVPNTVDNLIASSRKGTVTTEWSAHMFKGGSALTHYTVNTYLDGKKHSSVDFPMGASTAMNRATVESLEVGESYTVGMTVSNSVGASPEALYGPVEVLAGDIANPGFEHDLAGWLKYGSGFVHNSVTTKKAHSGSKSLTVDEGTPGADNGVYQTGVTITPDTSVLTFWATSVVPKVGVSTNNGDSWHTHMPVEVAREGSWTKYELNMSGAVGSTMRLTIFGDGKSFNLDDVLLESR